mgnify:CR=1 FL=1
MFNFFKRKSSAKPADEASATESEATAPESTDSGTDSESPAEPASPSEVPRSTPSQQGSTSEDTPSDSATPSDQADAGRAQATETSTQTPSQGADPASTKPKGMFARLKAGLAKTRKTFSDGLASLVLGKKEIDDDLLDELEMILLSADIGIEATDEIIENLTDQVSRKTLKDPQALIDSLKAQLKAMLEPVTQPLAVPDSDQPYVILMVGVNGVGKTTTIGKLAKKFQLEDRSVMLAAGDTFRAAAVEQLETWGQRNQVPVMAQKTGADSAAVIFDAIQSAQAKNIDVLIADTAGRLHTQNNLMEELKKVKRVMQKVDASAPHEIMLVLDAGNGQNALSQAQQFHQAVGVTGLTLTKLDGTAKGGIIVALSKQLGLPVRFIGVGETLDDLRPFDARAFVDALFSQEVSD